MSFFFSKKEPEKRVQELAAKIVKATDTGANTGAKGAVQNSRLGSLRRMSSRFSTSLRDMVTSEPANDEENLLKQIDAVILDWQSGDYEYTIEKDGKQETVDCRKLVDDQPYQGGKRLAVLKVLVGDAQAQQIVEKIKATNQYAFLDHSAQLADFANQKIYYNVGDQRLDTNLRDKIMHSGFNAGRGNPISKNLIIVSGFIKTAMRGENAIKEYLKAKYDDGAHNDNLIELRTALKELLEIEDKEFQTIAAFDEQGLNPGITQGELKKILTMLPPAPEELAEKQKLKT